jgi:hypothetical protein
VARYTESITVDKPFEEAWQRVQVALMTNAWNIAAVRDNTFFIRERLSFEAMLWRNPCRFAVNLGRKDDASTIITVFGSTLGFGPFPKGRLRQVADVLKGQLAAAMAAPSE